MKNFALPTVLEDRLMACWHDVHWARMVIQMECLFDGHLDEQRLARAVRLALDSEPVLGSRFVSEEAGCYWARVPDEERTPMQFTTDPAEYQAFATAPFDPRQEQSLKVILLRQPQGDCLLFRVSHLAADAAGTREVVATVAYIYRRLRSFPDWIPDANLKGQRGLSQVFRTIGWKGRLQILENLFRMVWQNRTRLRRFEPLARDEETSCWVVRHLPPSKVELLREWGKVRGATLNDLFVAAFLRAIVVMNRSGSGLSHRLRIAVDLRRYLPDRAAGGVCNLSAFEYVDVGKEPFASYPEAVARVVACTKRRKANWIGLSELALAPILRRLKYHRLRGLMAFLGKWGERRLVVPNTLSNSGAITPLSVDFGIKPGAAHILVPVIIPPLLGVGISSYDGQFTISIGVPTSARPQTEQFLDAALAELPV